MIKIEDLVAGESYACRFKITGPGAYEGIGVLITRDLDQKLVKLRDTETLMEFVVPFDNIWDIDYVNWTDSQEEP
jgi:hypothetical protein